MRLRSAIIFSAVSVIAFLFTLLLFGCTPAATPREQARSVVLTIAEGVRQGDVACASFAKTQSNLAIAYQCAAIVAQARDQLIAAEDVVDAWDDTAAGRLACSMKSAAAALAELTTTVSNAGGQVPAAVDDAIRLAPVLTGACNDAG